MQVNKKHKNKGRDKGENKCRDKGENKCRDKGRQRKCHKNSSDRIRAVEIAEAVKERLGEDFVSGVLVDAVEEILGYDTSGEMEQVLIDAIEKIDADSNIAEQMLDNIIDRLDTENAALIKAIASQENSRPYAYGKEPGLVCAEKAAADKAKARASMAESMEQAKAEARAEALVGTKAAVVNPTVLERNLLSHEDGLMHIHKHKTENYVRFFLDNITTGSSVRAILSISDYKNFSLMDAFVDQILREHMGAIKGVETVYLDPEYVIEMYKTYICNTTHSDVLCQDIIPDNVTSGIIYSGCTHRWQQINSQLKIRS